MIEIVFTLDYEIYGNGTGSLRDLVYEPAERLKSLFLKHGARFVVFPEAAELEQIESFGTDPLIGAVKKQLRGFHAEGFELGLHIHPWWYNARREDQAWVFERDDYNLCVRPAEHIEAVVGRAIGYLRRIAGDPTFTPLCFRAGHLLFQPTRPLADILAAHGVRLDSSVYRGGLWRQHKLDYRRAPKQIPFWRFRDDVIVADPQGEMLELPIFTWQAPVWRLFTSKRVALQQTGLSSVQTSRKILRRLGDFSRFRYPLKFDLGQMTADEMIRTAGRIFKDDRRDPSTFRPVVVLMHTKDPLDHAAADALLDDLNRRGIRISTFSDILRAIPTPKRGQNGR